MRRILTMAVVVSALIGPVVLVGQLSTAQAAGEPMFQPLASPQRLLDTREGASTADGQFAGIGLQPAGATVVLRVAGRVGIAADASAVVLNVTAVDPLEAGFLTVYPCGAERPVASNLNYYAQTSVPNAVIAKVGLNGDVCIYTLSSSHIAVDVAGVLPAGSYAPLDAPRRLVDTRPGGETADGQFAGNGQRPAGSTLELRVAGRAGVAPDAPAVVLNVTAVDPHDLGFLTVFPCGAPQPNASNVNYYPGTTVPNAVVTKVGTDGNVCIFTLADSDVVVDVAGVLPSATFTALPAPQRVLDTRPGGATADGQLSGTGRVPAMSSVQLRVGGRVGVPINAGAVVLNVTAVDPSAPGFVSVFPKGEQQPNTSNVNYYAGRTVANTVIAKLGSDDSVCLYTLASTDLVVDVAGYLPIADAPAAPGLGCPQASTVGSPAAAVLAAIPVADEQPLGFDRTLFSEWLDVDGDGCAADELVLIRDSLEPPVLTPTCDSISGRWYSPYDGLTWTLATEVQIDHVVSLKESWDSGANAWSPERRAAFANDLDDPRTLRTVSAAIDDTKQTNDPANWMPPLESDWCRYLGDHIAIKARWGLAMDQVEHDDIAEMLALHCAGLQIAAWPSVG